MSSFAMEGRAAQACARCRMQKRRCDKAFPRCSLCRRQDKRCEYVEAKPETLVSLKERLFFLEQRLAGSEKSDESPLRREQHWSPLLDITPSSSFPASFFHDSVAYQQARLGIPHILPSVPLELLNQLGSVADVREMVDLYFSTIHLWLPIIWKRRIYRTLSDDDFRPASDMCLLLCCMKLLSAQPTDQATGPLYQIAKIYYSLMETSGVLSIPLIQSGILIAAYEIGHGIYPAANLSAGRCVVLGQAMGLHNRDSVQLAVPEPISWSENEELRRVWYGVLILNRYNNIGFRKRPLLSDFALGNLLPCNTGLWDDGEVGPSERLLITSPTDFVASPFARTCQVAYLLGQVISHRDDSLDKAFRCNNAMQLDRTLWALLQLLWQEFATAPQTICPALSLALSTSLILNEPYSCDSTNYGLDGKEAIEMQEMALFRLKILPCDVARLALYIEESIDISACSISPLICDCLYQAAATLEWFLHERPDGQMENALRCIRRSLELLDGRWKAAGKFLETLDAVAYRD